MTDIIWDPKARDFLRKLDKHIANRIYITVEDRISNNVERYLESLKGYDFLKIRVGDYRLFVDYYRKDNLLIIRMVDYRGKAYKHLRRTK